MNVHSESTLSREGIEEAKWSGIRHPALQAPLARSLRQMRCVVCAAIFARVVASGIMCTALGKRRWRGGGGEGGEGERRCHISAPGTDPASGVQQKGWQVHGGVKNCSGQQHGHGVIFLSA